MCNLATTAKNAVLETFLAMKLERWRNAILLGLFLSSTYPESNWKPSSELAGAMRQNLKQVFQEALLYGPYAETKGLRRKMEQWQSGYLCKTRDFPSQSHEWVCFFTPFIWPRYSSLSIIFGRLFKHFHPLKIENTAIWPAPGKSAGMQIIMISPPAVTA